MYKEHNTKKIHRCEGSLKESVSVHLCDPYPKVKGWSGDAWWLLKAEQDFDTDSWYLQPVCRIRCCPFCGEPLEEMVNQ